MCTSSQQDATNVSSYWLSLLLLVHQLDVHKLTLIRFPYRAILVIRVFEGRNLRHRMVGRTVVIGDCPWVSQCAESFLGKIFACSYSIAGCGVLSGNPTDHVSLWIISLWVLICCWTYRLTHTRYFIISKQLVHRHTHRVVRGSLLLCGRPDGRLSALTSMETSVCLSINQASSIQSIGGTCESVTIVSGELLSLSRFFVHRNVQNYRNLHYFNILYLGSQSVSTSFKQESNLFG